MTDHPGDSSTPADHLFDPAPSQGNVRNLLERYLLAPVSEEQQRVAGDASALAALARSYDVTDAEMVAGLTSVAGAHSAAGAERLSTPDPDVPQEDGVAAFFDVDNTLIQGASILLFAWGLAKRRFFRPTEVFGFAWKQLKFTVTGKENLDDVASGRERALELIRGHRVDEIVTLGERIFDEAMDARIYRGTRELAQMHLAAGQEVWLVTATPVELAQVIARRLGLTGALGTVAETEEGLFTGRLVGDILHGPGKKHAVAALAAADGLDLDRCTAYSDSINDLPMLSMVGTAVAVNPDRQLRRAAQERGWEIRDYRRVRTSLARLAPAVRSARGVAVTAAVLAAVGAAGVVARKAIARRRR